MKFSEYQDKAFTTARYPVLAVLDDNGSVAHRCAWVYPALGLGGECGEILEKVKKSIRDDLGEMTDERRKAIAKELGDVLWYLSATAMECGLKLEDVAQANLDKLFSRRDRGRKLVDDHITLLVTLYQHTEGFGDSVVRCALKFKPWPGFDHEYLRENEDGIRKLLPMHVESIGPIVAIEHIFDVQVCDDRE